MMAVVEQDTRVTRWYSRVASDVAAELGVDPEWGLDAGEVERRLGEYGPNELPKEPPPSVWEVARGQLSNSNLNPRLSFGSDAALVRLGALRGGPSRANGEEEDCPSRLVGSRLAAGAGLARRGWFGYSSDTVAV
jgi:hypothetical protein